MKTILLPTDFSDSTAHAINWAQGLASAYDATLVLLHVQTYTATGATMPLAGEVGLGLDPAMGALLPGPDLPDLEPALRGQLSALADGFRHDGIDCRIELRWGAVKDVILDVAADHEVDLIITGRSHLGGFFDRLLGTTATGVARGAHCPVLIVPTGDLDELAEIDQESQLQSIVFATPLEFDEDDTFRQVVELAHRFEASLRILHVEAENQPNLVDDAEMLAQLQAVYGAEPLALDTVRASSVSGGIGQYLETHAPSLLVLTTRERDFLSGLLNPSITSRLVGRTNLPLLVYQRKGDD
ncbi:universal stress protein [Spirosoma luteolum]